MTPVITAVVAGFLAGAIALYRERRLELARLLVAARVLRASFLDAGRGIGIFAQGDAPVDRELFEATLGAFDLKEVWSDHREVLARHLKRREWDSISWAVTFYFVATVPESGSPVAASQKVYSGAEAELHAAADALSPYCQRAGFLRNPRVKVLRADERSQHLPTR